MNADVPQETNLSTALFLLFLDDIKKIRFNGEIFPYSDDVAIINAANTKNSNEELERNGIN